MNIAIGKMGRSIYFNKDRRSMIGGDEEAPLLYTLLAKRYPQHNFYLIGKSDYTSYKQKINEAIANGDNSIEPLPNNIIDLYDNFNSNSLTTSIHQWLMDKINSQNIKFDFGIIYSGPLTQVAIPGMGTLRLDGKGEAKTLVIFTGYLAPIQYCLNETQMPWINLVGDPKSIPIQMRDLLNEPAISLSQINTTTKSRRIAHYTDSLNFHEASNEFIYSGLETVFMLDEKKVDWRNINKDIKITIGLNGGLSRDDFMREWFINPGLTDIKVYGASWSDEFTKAFPNMFEEKRISEVEDEFFRTRYTIIPPPHKVNSKFVTQKFWKTIYYGIIPFFHPQYDTDKLLDIPDFLRVKNVNELYEKMDYLDNNPDEYNKIKLHLWNLLDDSYFNGDFLHSQVVSNVEKYLKIKM